jgi:hypothetical protein
MIVTEKSVSLRVSVKIALYYSYDSTNAPKDRFFKETAEIGRLLEGRTGGAS